MPEHESMGNGGKNMNGANAAASFNIRFFDGNLARRRR